MNINNIHFGAKLHSKLDGTTPEDKKQAEAVMTALKKESIFTENDTIDVTVSVTEGKVRVRSEAQKEEDKYPILNVSALLDKTAENPKGIIETVKKQVAAIKKRFNNEQRAKNQAILEKARQTKYDPNNIPLNKFIKKKKED